MSHHGGHSTISGTSSSHNNFLYRCPVVRDYPLNNINICSDRLADFFPDHSAYHNLALQVQRFLKSLTKSWNLNDCTLRFLLGDSSALTTAPTSKVITLRSDEVSSILAIYRILDLEILRIHGTKLSTSPTPCPNAILPEMLEAKLVRDQWKKLENWKNILILFKDTINDITTDSQAIVKNLRSKLRGSFAHLQLLGEMNKNQKIWNLLSNFCGSALHYTLIKETSTHVAENYLPGIPDASIDIIDRPPITVCAQDLSKYDPSTLHNMKRYLTEHNNGELRLPLHLSLLISPLFLLMPISLVKCQFPRTSVYELSIALGNQKPDILARVEDEIWKTLWKISENPDTDALTSALSALSHAGPIVQALNLSSEDPAFSFFCTSTDRPALHQENSLTRSPALPVVEKCAQHASNSMRTDAAKETSSSPSKSVQHHDIGSISHLNERDPNFIDGASASALKEGHQSNSASQAVKDFDMATAGGSAGEPGEEEETGGDNDVIMKDREDHSRVHSEEEEDEGNADEIVEEEQSKPTNTNIEDAAGEAERHADSDKAGAAGFNIRDQLRPTRISNPQHSSAALAAIRATKGSAARRKRSKPLKSLTQAPPKKDGKFEGTAPRAWIKLEEEILAKATDCTLNLNEKPKIALGRTVVVWGPNGDKHEIEPKAHLDEVLKNLDLLASAIEKGYDPNGKALFVKDDNAAQPNGQERAKGSVFKIITEDQYLAMEDSEVQEILRHQHIVITNIRHKPQDFESALHGLAPLNWVTTIQDQSYGPIDDGRVHKGRVSDILMASKSANHKILNALHFPNHFPGPEPSAFSSDSYAQRKIAINKAIPTGHMWWKLAALKHAFHHWHIDSDGFATFIEVIAGAKLWIAGRPLASLNSDIFNETSLFLDEKFKLDNAGEGLFGVEAIYLQPGSRLIMRPNTLHAVYTPDHAVCRGGHFYASSTIQDTFIGLVHAFIADFFITNTSHFPSRLILARMIGLYHSALVLNELHPSDPACSHVPDPTKDESMVDILVLCIFGVLINVLSFETYLGPLDPGVDKEEAPAMTTLQAQDWEKFDRNALTEDDRKLCCLARGQSFEIVKWLNAHFIPGGLGQSSNISLQEVFWKLLVDICKTVYNYKYLNEAIPDSEEDKFYCIPDLTLDRLQLQIVEVLTWATQLDEDSAVLASADSSPTHWTMPISGTTKILPDWLQDLRAQKVANNSCYKALPVSALFRVGETRLDKKFAEALDRKHGIKEDATVQMKKRKLSTQATGDCP